MNQIKIFDCIELRIDQICESEMKILRKID